MYQPQFYPGKWQFQIAKGTARKMLETLPQEGPGPLNADPPSSALTTVAGQLIQLRRLIFPDARKPPQTSSTTWNIDPAHSVAEFRVKHMMIANVKGQFSKVSGVLVRDESDPANELNGKVISSRASTA
jgi:polyisoprenoid-binding protein YceI